MDGNSVDNPGKDKSASEQIDEIINEVEGWKREILIKIRKVISEADPRIYEEVKWKKPSNPAGIPVWSYNGIICFGNILKNSVRLTFPKGSKIVSDRGLFNSRMDSKTVRAVDYFENDIIDEEKLTSVILQILSINELNALRKK